MRHDEAVRVLYFAELERAAINDFEDARKRGDGQAMRAAAIRWERAESQNSNTSQRFFH
jgi:hypothetical protein